MYIFLVNNIPEGTSTLSSFISPTPSTVVGTTQVFSIVSTASASFQHSIRTTHLALYESTSFSLVRHCDVLHVYIVLKLRTLATKNKYLLYQSV